MSPTDIANQALSRLGQAMVSDIAENSPSAIVCRTHYELVRDSLLRQHPWNFAVARAQLTESDETPAFGWDHQFALPSDRLRLLTLNGVQAAMCASDFETEGDYLLTDADEAKITYVRRVTDPTLFDPIFVEVLVLRLGGAIAVALTGSEQKRNELEALADAKMREATFADVGERRATVRGPVINRLASAPGEGFDRNTTYLLPVEGGGGSGGGAWGEITGTLSDQTDLVAALALKLNAASVSAFSLTLFDDADATAWRATLGLGTAATTAATAYATAAQGASADAAKTKTDYLTVTASTDLDSIRTRVTELDASVILKGTWDASSGSFPGSGAAQAGWSYIVSVAGTVGGVAFVANDRILAIADNASTSTYASNWHKLDYTDAVLSVAGQTGAVTLATSDIGYTPGTLSNWNSSSDPGHTGDALDQLAARVKTMESASYITSGSSPTFSAVTVNGGGNALTVTGTISGTTFSAYPYFAVNYPTGKFVCSSGSIFGWTSGDILNSIDIGFARNASGIVEVNNGTAGTLAYIKAKLRTDTNYTSGDPSTTGYLVIYDAAGTAYKIPAEAV